MKTAALQNAIFNSTSFSSIATDEKGVIQIFNIGAERMLGYTALDVVNRITPSEISDPREIITRAKALSIELGTPIKPGFEAMVFKASRGIEDIYELTYIRKDKSRLPAIVSVTSLRDEKSNIIGYLLIGTDNTARKLIEAERRKVETKLQMAMAAAEKANLAKSEFLSSMSHELRTPLSAILGFAQLMETSTPPPTAVQQRSISQILKAGWYLLDLINEILDLALVESGKLSLSLEPIALSHIMQECQAMIESQAQERGIKVAFPNFPVPCFIHADRTRMKQILINLLSNAIKYNRADGAVVVSFQNITPERIRICVQDKGEGLPPEHIAQLFQPFNRLGQETTVVEGTGIGLVMTKRLIELMGGSIGVESAVGIGSTFWVEVNLSGAPQVEEDAPALTAQASDKTSAKLHKLLYVEDNPANLMLVEDLITRRPDIQLFSAMDGISGVEMALSLLPDVILMDINLPGINGIRVMEILAADPRTAKTPVVALSANAMPRDIQKGLEAGFFRYLTKPIKVNEFMETLDVAMQFSGAQKSGS
ncbi:MAG: ATP-binding protein [Gammaproteobacteria bacterium]|nr:ATP-binding protein [Gammaproteobacteria bacterium]MDP2141723.1 ATP-binding protein [Gammaproteobacteria bacterium]MDP2347958.1 ATP-binding protein [Gammaproteobacteria bacterium]